MTAFMFHLLLPRKESWTYIVLVIKMIRAIKYITARPFDFPATSQEDEDIA